MQEQLLTLEHEFFFRVSCGPPHEVGIGPFGKRQFHDLAGGCINGPRINGKQIGSGSDWMLSGADNFLRMNVRVQIETDDGAFICVNYDGPIENNHKLTNAITACKSTSFSDHIIRSNWRLESGDERYAWLNHTIFVGQGRVAPVNNQLGFEHQVFRLT